MHDSQTSNETLAAPQLAPQPAPQPAPQAGQPAPQPPFTDNRPIFASQINEERAQLEARFKRGAQWFYWIAALSLINSVIAVSGGQWRFIFGLGLTQLVDAVVQALQAGALGGALAFAFDLMVAGLFVVFGYLSGRKMRWAFFTGMSLYVLDALLLLLLGEYLSAAVHAYVLYMMWSAVGAIKRLGELEQSA
jgi:hypothetical protein